jgi:hypothetical protein
MAASSQTKTNFIRMKKILFFFCFALLFINNNAMGQLVQADSTFVYINGEGTFIKLGKGEGTVINLLTTVQPGVQFGRLDSLSKKTNNSRMSLNLVRLSLMATNARNKVSVGLVTDFTGTSPILEGWIGYDVSKRAKLILGQKQSHTNNRLAMADERYAQTMGQTIAGKSNDGTLYGGLMQNFVGATREGGLFLETNFNINKMRIYPSVSLTTGEGQNFFSSQPTSSGFKYGGRLDMMPLGDFIKNNAFIAHDIYREPKPKLVIGVAASLNQKASSPIGSESALISGIYNASGKADLADYRKIVVDFAFKNRGFALIGEYIKNTVSGKDLFTNAGATNKLTAEVASTFYNLGSAVNIQSSYVFKTGWAIDGRYAIVKPEFDIAGSKVSDQKWATFGINKYIKNNALRVGINTNYIESTSPTVSTKKWINNFAVQILL